MSKVYISYLATKLNHINKSKQNFQDEVDHPDKDGNGREVDAQPDGADQQLKLKARTELVKILRRLAVRDEAEIIQTAQALAFTTAKPDELCPESLYISLEILKSITYAARDVYGYGDLAPVGNLVPVVLQSAASIVSAIQDLGQNADEMSETVFKDMIIETIQSVENLVLNELQFHVTSETPITASTDFLSILAIKHSAMHEQSLEISNARFQFPETFVSLLQTQQGNQSASSTNQNCLQSHMITFKRNPYSLNAENEVGSLVSGLTLYDCAGEPVQVKNLTTRKRIQVELPNILQQKERVQTEPDLILRKWSMSIHQFNVTTQNLEHALHLVIELVPVNKGRLFPVTVLLSHHQPPTPEYFLYKYEGSKDENFIDVFLPPGFFNVTGKYFFGIVDATYNSGRLRQGEVTFRNYTFKLWWGECLFWDEGTETWTPEGCAISPTSSFRVTKCECNHLTAFGGRFDLIPNELTHEDVENFFSPNRNPVVLTLLSIVFILYFVLLLWSCHADRHDGQKGGIIYLLDNTPMDQQKYEITVETGIHSGAGTTAKISLILHGEEGMSETRELISEDSRPMFERNSRDKFILTLPDSIGKIWKVQIWHNNFGESPSWYVSRIIVRDLNTGVPYMFICEKWLAVEEEDGKVEREFMVLEGSINFTKALMSKSAEYMADFHTWLSVVTCPSYSGFKRTERLTLCLTILLLYMCLNAVWYRTNITEYRGEFGLLDVSLRNVTVGAIICGVVTPVGLLIEFLFRRSKPKYASSVHSKDEGEDWDNDYPSGKPHEVESEDTSEEHVPPVMTYSLLDQSIMNWPNIQTWAQKQWMKRQHMTNQGYHSEHSDESICNIMKPTSLIVESPFIKQALSEMDQASSGFEDCSSLIRPKASVDSTHTTAAPSVAESMRTHKPKSLPDSLRMSKPASNLNSTNTSKAPSISSTASHKSSVIHERKCRRTDQMYLPYGCRYVAWCLCALLCVGSATVTAMYGYRFGVTKSTLWLQSLFFSAMICVFISTPILIVFAVIYAALQYRRDPTSVLDVYDIFNRVKAKQDLMKWKTQMEMWFEGDALDRGVAARQRSRYLRFARPPQEKQLIESRKRVMKEKKALSVFRECVMFICAIILLLVMAYSKTTSDKYRVNKALENTLTRTGSHRFIDIKSLDDWYTWAQSDLLTSLQHFDRLDNSNNHVKSGYRESNYMIGSLQLRQQRVQYTECTGNLPYLMATCLGEDSATDGTQFMKANGISYRPSHSGNFIFGNHGVYDGSGYTVILNVSRSTAENQIEILKQNKWLDRASRAVFVEFTLYNPPTNLFIAVDLLLELPPLGVAVPVAKVTSTHVFRYTSSWDNILLACELLFFLVTMLWIKTETLKLIEQRKKYFTMPWNVLNLIICVTSMQFCICYVYRYVIVSSTVEALRNTYYETYVDVTFITFWDEILRWIVGILVFLSSVKSLRLLRYTKLFAVFGDVYRKARREIILFFALFTILQAGYASMGHVLFGSTVKSYSNIWSSLLAVTALLTNTHSFPDLQSPGTRSLSTNIFLFFFTVFILGFLTCYMVAVLSHYFRSRKRRNLLAMSGKEAVLFYLEKFQLWVGLKKSGTEEEPEIILPPEFTMAEIEYQVDELLFRMNALSGSHGLPEKPACYLTDSDCTYGGGDDGISSGGSESGHPFTEDRLEQRVQKIEDNLCSQEPFLAQLLKLDGVGMDILSMEKEKQLRSHLELEIFRQLQIQRQDHKAPVNTDQSTKCVKAPDDLINQAREENSILPSIEAPYSPGQDSTSSDEAKLLPHSDKNSRSRYGPSNITIQAIQDLLLKSAPDYMDFHNENSSSNPDSPREKITFTKLCNRSANDPRNKSKPRQLNSSTSSSEKISPDLSLNHAYMYERDNIRKPTKPTFLHSRDSSFSDAQKNSPIMKLRTHISDKPMKPEQAYTGVERLIESSSGSEQDGFQVGRKILGKRSLRKTKSRGKGKGADEGLGPALVLDELEGEDTDFNQDFAVEGLHKELMDVYEERMNEIKHGGVDFTRQQPVAEQAIRSAKEHTVRADVHHSSDSQ